MKILYLISVIGHGNGGHFYSLDQISSSISKSADVAIVSIGKRKSNIISNNNFFLEHIYFSGINIIKYYYNILRLIKKFNPEVIHCFDEHSYNLIKLINYKKAKIVLTKCGGPNPIRYPKSENLIVFSEENFNWFKSNKNFSSANINFIPNRILKLNILKKSNYPEKKENLFSIVRITRIGHAYKNSIMLSINLIKELNKELNVVLYIIGVIQDRDVYDEIRLEVKDLPVVIITEAEFIYEASKMLYLADAVIATGRGLMEASSLGLPILTPAKDRSYPVLVTETNFNSLFGTNFSQRNISITDDNFELDNIKKMINDSELYIKHSLFSKKMFELYFNVESVIEKYLNLYRESIKSNSSIDFKLTLRTLKTFYKN